MPRVEAEIINKLGLHARAAAKFVQTAQRYSADVKVTRGEKTVNGKSIMGVMMLAAGMGTTIALEAEGDDAGTVLAELTELINDRFGEPE